VEATNFVFCLPTDKRFQTAHAFIYEYTYALVD